MPTLGEYEALAVSLGRDPAALAAAASNVLKERDFAPALDDGTFVGQLSKALKALWDVRVGMGLGRMHFVQNSHLSCSEKLSV